MDDVINEASLHPGVVVFPALLSVVSTKNSSGKKMITAASVGYEVMARLGRGLDPSEPLNFDYVGKLDLFME